MQTSAELKNLLQRIDHKGYPAYKDTRGSYEFPGYVLSIDHVQGDPFAAPSKVSIHVRGKQAGFPEHLYQKDCRRTAVQDYLLRQFARQVEKVSFKAKGSGKSGLMAVSCPGQEVLERSACQMDAKNGDIVLRMEIGFPANGRTVNSRELEKIFFDFLPECVKGSLYFRSLKKEAVETAADLAEDQAYIREQLDPMGLCAFVADGAILPRESGVSGRPMKDAVRFQSPESLSVTLTLPHHGKLTGMGIKKGITLIVGGGYHGKSTLLKALETGVYNHIAGDGREYVITDDTAMKIRAEDGRSIRDELMQRVVNRDAEPIVPFIDRVEELYHTYGISTVLVAGSSGSYFHKADCIIQMNRYEPFEITESAKQAAAEFPLPKQDIAQSKQPDFDRKIKPDRMFQEDNRLKMKTMGRDSISINREVIDVRYVEQLMDTEQLAALGYMLKYMQIHFFDGKHTLTQAVDALWDVLQKKGIAAVCESSYLPCGLAMPRKQEVFACVNRYRRLGL